MGEWRTTVGFKFSNDERQCLLEIHQALAPMHENHSQTVRWMVRVMHKLICIEGSLQILLAAMQGSQCCKPSNTDKQFTFHFAARMEEGCERRAR